MKVLFNLIPALFLFFACGNSNPVTEPMEELSEGYSVLFTDLFQLQDGGIFRGVEWDMTKEQVLNVESKRATSSVLENEDDKVIITSDMGEEVLNFADITYAFDEKGLYNIGVETFAVDKETSNMVYEEVIKHLNEKYGQSEVASDGFTEFKDSSKKLLIAVSKIELEDSFGMYIYFEYL